MFGLMRRSKISDEISNAYKEGNDKGISDTEREWKSKMLEFAENQKTKLYTSEKQLKTEIQLLEDKIESLKREARKDLRVKNQVLQLEADCHAVIQKVENQISTFIEVFKTTIGAVQLSQIDLEAIRKKANKIN
jgi:predicted RNase H-like nuclease (RuvC/YqgF family)